MKYKIIKIIRNAVSIVLLGAIFINVTTIMSKAATYSNEKQQYTWTTWSYYEIDEDVSPFKPKSTYFDMTLYIYSANNTMRMRCVGANSEEPGENYADCSGGLSRTVVIDAGTNRQYYVPSKVVTNGYSYAGILATSIVDGRVDASGYFLTN